MKNGKLILLRHAEFAKPVPGAYYGQSDLPLTEHGEAQARALAGLIARIEPGIYRVYSSDMIRTRRTAELALPGAAVIEDAALREMSFGEWEGLGFKDISGRAGYDAFARGEGAPGGESEAAFAARVCAAVDGIMSENEGNVAVVAHAGVIRHAAAHLLGLEAAQNWRFKVDMASLSVITVADGYAYLSALNLSADLFAPDGV